MLLSLCLLVLRLHAPASGAFGAPSEHIAPASVGGAPTTTSISNAAVASARDEASHRDQPWLRAAQHHVAFAPSRVAQPFSVRLESRSSATRLQTPTADAAGRPRATDAAVRISLGARAHDASREDGGSGALLAYYPTAPPLQG